MTDGAAAYVAEATIAWDQCRRESVRLKAERASFRCEYECEAEYDDMGRPTYDGDPACWRNVRTDQYGDHPLDVSDWCEPCRQRQKVHDAYRMAVRRRQGLLRGLQRRALAAWEEGR